MWILFLLDPGLSAGSRPAAWIVGRCDPRGRPGIKQCHVTTPRISGVTSLGHTFLIRHFVYQDIACTSREMGAELH
jgi:hypothetical protein